MKKPDLKTILLFICIGVIIFMAVLNVDEREFSESVKLENERILRDSKKAVKRFEAEAQAERESRKAIEADFIALEARSKKSDSAASYWQKQFIHEKNRKTVHYSDAGYDSAINRLYPN